MGKRNPATASQPAGSRHAQGFTIIEVLIVLAIAGLILLLVFQAIPALQRSSRNNQRKQDVTAVLEAVSHYELNHSGTFPGSAASNFLQYSKLQYYDTTTAYGSDPGGGIGVYAETTATTPTTVAPITSLTIVRVYNYQKCSTTTNGGSTSTGAGYSDVVVLYALESGNNGTVGQCQEL